MRRHPQAPHNSDTFFFTFSLFHFFFTFSLLFFTLVHFFHSHNHSPSPSCSCSFRYMYTCAVQQMFVLRSCLLCSTNGVFLELLRGMCDDSMPLLPWRPIWSLPSQIVPSDPSDPGADGERIVYQNVDMELVLRCQCVQKTDFAGSAILTHFDWVLKTIPSSSDRARMPRNSRILRVGLWLPEIMKNVVFELVLFIILGKSFSTLSFLAFWRSAWSMMD